MGGYGYFLGEASGLLVNGYYMKFRSGTLNCFATHVLRNKKKYDVLALNIDDLHLLLD